MQGLCSCCSCTAAAVLTVVCSPTCRSTGLCDLSRCLCANHKSGAVSGAVVLVGPSPGLSVQEVPELLARSYRCLPPNHTYPWPCHSSVTRERGCCRTLLRPDVDLCSVPRSPLVELRLFPCCEAVKSSLLGPDEQQSSVDAARSSPCQQGRGSI